MYTMAVLIRYSVACWPVYKANKLLDRVY